MSEFIPEDLFVDEPIFTVRWRLHCRALPLKNRHLRAFEQRNVGNGLASWARQHIEWTLAEGTAKHPDGVLVLAVDEQGRAVMSAEAYEPLAATGVSDLLERVAGQEEQPVEGEVVWVFRDGAFTVLADGAKPLSGVNSLVADLAKTLGKPVAFVPRAEVAPEFWQLAAGDEVMLVSDEHGVVGAAGASGEVTAQFAAYYARIVGITRPDVYDRANLGIIG